MKNSIIENQIKSDLFDMLDNFIISQNNLFTITKVIKFYTEKYLSDYVINGDLHQYQVECSNSEKYITINLLVVEFPNWVSNFTIISRNITKELRKMKLEKLEKIMKDE